MVHSIFLPYNFFQTPDIATLIISLRPFLTLVFKVKMINSLIIEGIIDDSLDTKVSVDT